MAVATVTSKGQVTVPAAVRKALKIRPGDRLVFTMDGDTIVVTVVPNRTASELFGAIPATRPFPGKSAVRDEVASDLGRQRSEK
jgi:AbrB family looped-hinge helix DNA binding protein